MKNTFIVKKLPNAEEFYKLNGTEQQTLLSGKDLKKDDDDDTY